MLLSLIRPILGHPLSIKITGFIPLRQKYLWELMLKVVTESHVFHKYCTTISFPGFRRLVLGLFPVYSDYGYIYFISSFSTIVVVCTFEMEAFMAMVSVVNLMTIALYSSFSGVRNLLLIIIIIVDCYCYYLIQSALPAF